MKDLRVGIVGSGTAGPAAAILLAEAGHHVTLLERAPTIEAVGAGILLQPAGQSVLDHMGLLDEVQTRAARVDQLLGHTASGRLVLDLAYANLQPEFVGLGVHRAALIDIFLNRIKATDRCTLRCDADIQGIERRGDGWLLRQQDGDEAGPFDLVVLAAGSRSKLRDATGLVRSTSEYPWGALWAIVPDPDSVFPRTLRQVYQGNGTFLGFLPTGRISPDSEPLVSIFWSLRNDRAEALRATPFENLRDEMIALCPQGESALARIQGWDQLIHARYMDVTLKRPHLPGLVCIGDTSHAMSPQLGQGVTLALQDAWELAQAVERHERLDRALSAYAAKRRDTLRFYQFANRAATWFFQGDSDLLARVRDWTFGPLNHLPFYRGQMLRTLAGFKRGFVRSEAMPMPSLQTEEGPASTLRP
jgi:2-polyprenyl-6-methoxyphenol hydroxylase-like FAD-dependent oxidoreductase